MILDDPGNVTVIFAENRQSLTICDWKNEIFYIGGNFYKRVPEGMDGPCRGCALAFNKEFCDTAQNFIGCVCQDFILNKIL